MSMRIVYAQEPYRILLTNDDGYDAPGIMTLYQELSSMPNTEVLIVAPNQNYSGAGHWVMLDKPDEFNSRLLKVLEPRSRP